VRRIILDCDEILADFVGGAARIWGLTRESLLLEWEAGFWDMVPPLGRTLGKIGVPGPQTQEEFWDRINGDEDFWASLDPLPWFSDIIGLVSGITNDWHVATAPSRCASSYSGKVKWIRKHLGADFDRFAITPHKYIFAAPGVLLIDDRDSNCSDFVRHGGEALTFPAHHNRMWRKKDDPIAFVKSILGAMKRS
jgi:hypothetical protein